MTTLAELERFLGEFEAVKDGMVAQTARTDQLAADLADLRRRAEGGSK